jgi:hypothetical protein
MLFTTETFGEQAVVVAADGTEEDLVQTMETHGLVVVVALDLLL